MSECLALNHHLPFAPTIHVLGYIIYTITIAYVTSLLMYVVYW